MSDQVTQHKLRELRSSITMWLSAWQALLERLVAMDKLASDTLAEPHRVCQAIQADADAVKVLAGHILGRIQPFLNQATAGTLLPAAMDDLHLSVEELESAAIAVGAHPRKAGSLLWGVHGYLKNIAWALAGERHHILGLLPLVAGRLRQELPEAAETLAKLNAGIAGMQTRGSVEALRATLDWLNEQIHSLTPISMANRKHSRTTVRDVALVIVEDDAVLGNVIKTMAASLQQRLAGVCSINVLGPIDNTEEAWKTLKKLAPKKVGQITPKRVEHILLLDLGVPKKHGEDKVLASREYGLDLLEKVSKLNSHVQTIILTTPANFLEDHLRAYRLGVSDYLLKEGGVITRLEDRLIQVLQEPVQVVIEISDPESCTLTVNGVQVSLQPVCFRTFYAMCQARQAYGRGGLTCEQIVTELARHFPSEGYGLTQESMDDRLNVFASNSPLVSNEADRANLRNLARLWCEMRLQASPRDAYQRCADGANPRLWKWTLALAERKSSDALEAFLDRTMAPLLTTAEGYSPDNIFHHVSEIRQSIEKVLSEMGQLVDAHRDVILTGGGNGRAASYQVVAEVRHLGELASESCDCVVVVVENEVETWQKPIRDLLENHGYKVRPVCNLEDALELVKDESPQIWCVDLHFPRTRREHLACPGAGDPEAGIILLEQLDGRGKAIALTSLAEIDALRVRAVKRGIRLDDWVAKDDHWRSRLVLSVWRQEQELLTGRILPIPAFRHLLYVGLLSRRVLKVNGVDRPLTDREVKLFEVLLASLNHPVAAEDIADAVYPGKEEWQNSVRCLIREVRTKIGHKWLGLHDPEAGEAALAILKQDGGRYTLFAKVASSAEGPE